MIMTLDVNCNLFSPEVLVDSSVFQMDISIVAKGGGGGSIEIKTKKKKKKQKKKNTHKKKNGIAQ